MTVNIAFFKALTALGLVLSFTGVFFFAATGGSSFLILLPSLFGLLFMGLAYLAVRRLRARTALILTSLLGLFGMFSSVQGSFESLSFLLGASVASPLLALAHSLLFLACLFVVYMSVLEYQSDQNADFSS